MQICEVKTVQDDVYPIAFYEITAFVILLFTIACGIKMVYNCGSISERYYIRNEVFVMSTTTVNVNKKYLKLPISGYVGARTLKIIKNGELLDDIRCRLDFVNPQAYAYYDVSAYIGKEITVDVSPDMDIDGLSKCMSDTAENRSCAFRPFVHFTVPFGWINDPNGLVVYTSKKTGKTVYHLFCQHNPYDWVWGNMHWGHAVSEDLIHWEYLGDVLKPDENGTMFSGSAIVDYENKSGLKDGDEDVIFLFYTCAGNTSVRSAGKKFTQCAAYSTDGGVTFKKYEKNPVVGHIYAENRDPKVIWCDEKNCFVMALYLDGNDYCLLVSDNLLDWTELQRVHLGCDCECPDFYPLTASNGEKKWILSGASQYYLVGDFKDGKFEAKQDVKHLKYGSSSYAAQTYSYPNNARRIQLAWDRETSFGNDPIRGQMGIPCELTLACEKGEYYLCASPAAECDKIVRDKTEYENIGIGGGNTFEASLEESAYILDVSLDGIENTAVEIEIFGQKIKLDMHDKTLHAFDKSMPLCVTGSGTSLCLVIDKGSVEAFADGGKAIMTVPWTADLNRKSCTITSSENIVLKKLTIRRIAL